MPGSQHKGTRARARSLRGRAGLLGGVEHSAQNCSVTRNGEDHRLRPGLPRWYAKSPYAVPLRQLPTDHRNEVPPPQSITSSALASSDGGTERSGAFAVFLLMISSYLVGACTGRSAGFSPVV